MDEVYDVSIITSSEPGRVGRLSGLEGHWVPQERRIPTSPERQTPLLSCLSKSGHS